MGQDNQPDYYPFINKLMTTLRLRDMSGSLRQSSYGFPRPFITVARDPGSGGKPIAKKVAEKLGFLYVDEQIVDQIASSTKQRKNIIRHVDEKSRNAIEDIIHSILNKEYVDENVYISELIKVILAYAHQGHVVILGRAANFICPFAKGLHVNVTASYNERLRRAMDYEGFDMKKAKQVIAKVEKERADFVNQYFKRNVRNNMAYDLTINTAYFSIDDSAQIIINAFYKKFSDFHRLKAVLTR
ncbi:MAG: AAA family ATPase [Patescibacteria group bacterium]